MRKKKIWVNFQKIIELFSLKIATKLSKLWVWETGSGSRDPGSGKNPFRIPDPGSRGQKGTGSRIRIRNTDLHIFQINLNGYLYTIVAGNESAIGKTLSLMQCSGSVTFWHGSGSAPRLPIRRSGPRIPILLFSSVTLKMQRKPI